MLRYMRWSYLNRLIKKVQERLTVLKMNTDKRNTYFHYLKEAVHLQDVLTTARLRVKLEEKWKKLSKETKKSLLICSGKT